MKALFFILLFSLASPALLAAQESKCSWDSPGLHPYKLDPVVALKDYKLNPSTRLKLEKKMKVYDYDDFVEINRDGIKSDKAVYSNLRDMHFGNGSMCLGEVTRKKWKDKDTQRALIYCADGVCIAVPTVCNNVSLIDRKPLPPVAKPPEEVASLPVVPESFAPVPIIPLAPLEQKPPETFCDCDDFGFYGYPPIFFDGFGSYGPIIITKPGKPDKPGTPQGPGGPASSPSGPVNPPPDTNPPPPTTEPGTPGQPGMPGTPGGGSPGTPTTPGTPNPPPPPEPPASTPDVTPPPPPVIPVEPPIIIPPPVIAVPELSTFLSLLSGLVLLIAFKAWRRINKKESLVVVILPIKTK